MAKSSEASDIGANIYQKVVSGTLGACRMLYGAWAFEAGGYNG